MPGFITNWHHRVIADRLSALKGQKRQRIILSLQPQVGKSLLVSRLFPAWWLGHSPHAKIISSSYAVSLAESFNVDCQELIDSEAFRRIFKTLLPPRSSQKKRTQSYCQIANGQGYLYSVGVGGATLGKTGDIFIIDDPIKSPQEAFSPSSRKKIIDWYLTVAETRMALNGHVILMHQRWHKEDLAGYLLKEIEETGEDWEVMSFPAIAEGDLHPLDPREPGEPLWPEFKGDSALWEQMRKKAGPYFWSAIYQQKPAGEQTALISENDLRYFSPEDIDLKRLDQSHSWDMSFKSKEEQARGSYVVGQHWATDGFNYYLVNQIRGKWGFRDTHANFVKMSFGAPVSEVFVEDKANGPAILDSLAGIVPGLIPVEPKGDKFGRFAAISPLFHQGRVFLPKGASWLKDFKDELLNFPNGSNDDQVDSCSQYLSEKWNPEGEGLFSPYAPTAPSKWGFGGLSRPSF